MNKGVFLLIVAFLVLILSSSSIAENKEDLIKKLLEEGGRPIYLGRGASVGVLENPPDLSGVVGVDKKVSVFLNDVKNIINASSVWNLSYNFKKINGSGESVCVIDTGVDKNHPDLSSKVIAEYCFCSAKEGGLNACCPDGTSEDDNATDNHGHGTHVAGIVAAYGGISGIAKGANIVAVKVLNSSGVGFDSDVKAAINWCINDTRVSAYNISVISLSLGGGQYSSESSCLAADFLDVASAINAAVSKNISVVIATGNTGSGFTNNSAGIASPACLPNSTRVSATDKNDNPANYAFRNSNFTDIIFAPGSNINSTNLGGGYILKDGTSMAAPAVSGAIAMISQYLRLSLQKKSPYEIRDILNKTGIQINDTAVSGMFYQRIDAYSAILEFDATPPNVSLNSPKDNSVSLDQNKSFNCSASDWQLSNITLYVWNSSGIYNKSTADISGENNYSVFNLTNMPFGTYSWNCLSYDAKSNKEFHSQNYTLTIGGVSSVLVSPENKTYTNKNQTNFTCRSITEESLELKNVSFYLWNLSALVFNESRNISGTDNLTTFNFNFSEDGNYYWNCLSYNNQSNSSFYDFNYSIIFDSKKPMMDSFSYSSTSNSISINSNFSEESNLSILGDLSKNISNYSLSHAVTFSGLSPSTSYKFNLTYCDRAGNCNATINKSAKTLEVSSNGGGGGGGSASNSLLKEKPEGRLIKESELSLGASRKIKAGRSVNFSINGQNHSLKVLNTSFGAAKIEIYSVPIRLLLASGMEAKINLSSAEFFDLFIRVNEIEGEYANITIKKIKEKIYKEKEKGKLVRIFKKNPPKPRTFEEPKDEFKFEKIIVVLLVIILVLFFLIFPLKSEKNLRPGRVKRQAKKRKVSRKTKKPGGRFFKPNEKKHKKAESKAKPKR